MTNAKSAAWRIRIVCSLVAATAIVSGCAKTEVEGINPRIGEIRESFSEPATTRLKRDYPVTMPVSGRVARIELEPNDQVRQGQALAHFDRLPFEKAVAEAKAKVAELKASIAVNEDDRLEQTALVEAKAVIEAAEEALKAGREEVAAESARSSRAAKELARMAALRKSEAIPQSRMDDVTLQAETALIEFKKQEFYLAALKALVSAVNLGPKYVERYLERKKLERQVLEAQLSQANERLALATHQLGLAKVTAPIDGIVLKRFEQGDTFLQAGTPLLLLGNPAELEVVADVLSQDALRLSVGSPVTLEPAAGIASIRGKVTKIEAAGFTKLSSLGVEQQRVKVHASIEGSPEGLGVGYRVQARLFTGRKDDALVIPRFSVLQAPDRSFYVFREEDGTLRRVPVKLGLRNDLEFEVTLGLKAEDKIVARPDADMREGAKVAITKSGTEPAPR
ncbi:MAG: efflux RND transporter periplasmic adaptor subunit [Thermodesulfobacteriota bacterium]